MSNFSLWALLPPIYSVCTAAGLWVVYFIAVYNENIIPLGSPYRKRNGSFYPPYISLAGNFPPASCLFSEVMNLAAFVGFIITILRYLQLKNKIDKPWLNIGSLVASSVGFLGMTIAGNVQFFNGKMIHNLGAMMVFGLVTVYCWMQSYITLRVNLRNEGRKAAIARVLLSGSITLCAISYFSLMPQRLHVHATGCQWACVMLILIFISTFAIEFRHSSFGMVYADVSGYPISRSDTSEVPREQLNEL